MRAALEMQIELTLPLPPPGYEAWLEREQQPEACSDSYVDPCIIDDVTFEM